MHSTLAEFPPKHNIHRWKRKPNTISISIIFRRASQIILPDVHRWRFLVEELLKIEVLVNGQSHCRVRWIDMGRSGQKSESTYFSLSIGRVQDN